MQGVCNSLNDGKKDCLLSFVEIHIKPAQQYQEKYVVGNTGQHVRIYSCNLYACHKGQSIFWSPRFCCLFRSSKDFTADYLFEIVNQVLEVVHDAGGRVFSLMCDDLTVNQKTYKMLLECFDSLGVASVAKFCEKFQV